MVQNDPPVCTAGMASPAVLGTPYGWFRTVTVQGVTDPDGNRPLAFEENRGHHPG